MDRKHVVLLLTVCFLAAFFLPIDLFATTDSGDFGGAAIVDAAHKIKSFLFGPVRLFVAVLAAGYGVMQAVFGNLKMMITFFGVGVGTGFMPKFIDGVFSILLP
jgi:hypothetical protein